MALYPLGQKDPVPFKVQYVQNNQHWFKGHQVQKGQQWFKGHQVQKGQHGFKDHQVQKGLSWVQGPSNLERLPWVQGSSRTEISIKNSTIDSNNEVCDTRTECDMSHECVSSQYSSPEDNETGEDLRSFSSFSELQPNTIHSSNQSAYKDKVASTASGLDQNNIQPTTDSCYQSASESSSSSNSSVRKPFSISAATASSSSGKKFNFSSNNISSTEADVSSSSSPSSSSSQIQNVRIPIPNPVQEFQGIIVNTYSCKTPLKKENIKTCNDGCATDLKFSINIPSYLLIQIFQHLSMYELLHNVSSVCKLWYNISHDPDLWRVIDLQNQLKVTDVVITNLTSYSDRVIYLNISDITTISEDCLVKTVTNCQHLKTLKLSRCISVTTDRLLTAIGGHCHNLRDIHMELCFRITDKGLEDLAVGCPKLESVHISQCQNVGNKGLAQLAEHCPLLDSISVDSCAKIRDEGIIALANGCSEIRIINLHSCSIGDMGAYQLKNLKFLQTLDLSGSNELSLQTVSVITQNCTKLECLNLSLKRNVDDGYIEMVARHCTQLRKLYCVSCTITDTGLEFLGRYSQRLEHLDIGWCHAVTDAGVQFVSENCPALRYIGLIRCDQVTAEGIEDLLDKYPRITYSTFILESRKIIEMARMQGFQFPANNDDGKPSVVFWDNAS
ncbi:F-box/LRR-repeat protein 17-like [Pecten maximus]|uniref:F-box/LRR-repeat protein 17-like n=1 Tax=Pecten maximus TaxID=6579 RepID=UPI0014589D0C|nr:F-box/LRR-repeat protein 17-like [Pecten maximus]